MKEQRYIIPLSSIFPPFLRRQKKIQESEDTEDLPHTFLEK
jgi:hypothetical protein